MADSENGSILRQVHKIETDRWRKLIDAANTRTQSIVAHGGVLLSGIVLASTLVVGLKVGHTSVVLYCFLAVMAVSFVVSSVSVAVAMYPQMAGLPSYASEEEYDDYLAHEAASRTEGGAPTAREKKETVRLRVIHSVKERSNKRAIFAGHILTSSSILAFLVSLIG